MTFYQFAHALVGGFFSLLGWKRQGLENLPAEGCVIVVANHVSMWDPLVVGSALPRQVWFMAKEELFHVPAVGWAIRHLGAFPVKRGQGDTSAIRTSLSLLKEGKVLGLFPEGTRSRSGEMQKGLPGMVLLMEKSGATVVPVKVYGTRQLPFRAWGKFGLAVGMPLTPEMLKAPPEVENRREWVARRIMQAIEDIQV